MILTVTLNPAMDRLLFIPEFTRDSANRIYKRVNCIGGKAAHVSWNLADLGEPSTATGIAMGPTGEAFLDALCSAGVDCRFSFEEGGDTRTNYVIIEDSGACTLVCEKGPTLTQAQLNRFLEHFTGLVQRADYVVLSGDASNFSDSKGTTLQSSLMAVTQMAGARIILDASGKALKTCVESGPYLIKPNAEELQELTGVDTGSDAGIVAAVRTLDPYDIGVVAVSMGARGSIVRIRDVFYRVSPAQVTVRNSVGCGDAYLSGLVYGLSRNMSPIDMLRFAAGCGAAEAENERTVGLDAERAKTLAASVNVTILEG